MTDFGVLCYGRLRRGGKLWGKVSLCSVWIGSVRFGPLWLDVEWLCSLGLEKGALWHGPARCGLLWSGNGMVGFGSGRKAGKVRSGNAG